jgi:hypothetical protein
MQYLILGVVVLWLTLIAVNAFMNANPAVMARHLRVGAGVAVLAGAATLTVRGMISYAVPLGALGYWLIWGHGGPRWGGYAGRGQKAAGQTSRVTTEHLEMELDHDSGAMTGRVLKGMFAGRALDTLRPVDVALVWQDCRFTDPQSAQLLEAYLDRLHPSWREDIARGEQRMSGGPDGRMSAAEAWEILGLKSDASDDQIRQAHRELMQRMHPDRGGSTYLAAKINEAKDVLLGRKSG